MVAGGGDADTDAEGLEGKLKPLHIIVLQHGIDGCPRDLDKIREAIAARHAAAAADEDDILVWDTEANTAFWKTWTGVGRCTERIWQELLALLDEPRVSERPSIRLSLVGHSLGAILLRGVATRAHTMERAAKAPPIELDTYVSIAAPHLGCRRLGIGCVGGLGPLMGRGTYVMRAGMRMIKGTTGADLLLDNGAMEALTDEANCAALAAFRRRVVYCNATGDWTVAFESASLLDAAEGPLVMRAAVAGGMVPGSGVLWSRVTADAFRDALDTLPSLRLGEGGAGDDVAPALFALPLAPDWDAKATERLHATWDDTRLGGGERARLASSLLRRLRSVGEWEVHVAQFGSKASFVGLVYSPHIDIVHHYKCNNHAGQEVVEHVAGVLTRARERGARSREIAEETGSEKVERV